MSQFGGSKNSPWNRNSSPNMMSQNNSLQQQIMNQGGLGNMNTSGMVQFQQQHQQQVFQNALGLQQQNLNLGLQQMATSMGAAQIATNQILQQVGAVTYPNPRALNPNAFQTQSISAVSSVQNNSSPNSKQRVFTGTVTKVHDNFGFVDEDVFFHTNACVKGSNPMVGDRVLVEASFNPSMPFKWNATRIQVLPVSSQVPARQSSSNKNYTPSGGYNAVPPPIETTNGNFGRAGQRQKTSIGRNRDRSRDRDRDDDETERKKRREERMREREKEDRKSPIRRRSRSPKARRRSHIVPRYMVQIPKISLDLLQADVLEIRRRYGNLYIPSDFFFTHFRWVDAFPPDKPFAMNKPCSFHIMAKEVDSVVENDAVLEPPDADYLFSAKVMLMSIPPLEEVYQKCCAMAEDKDKRDRDSEEREFVHPTRVINFLVGLRGRNETMAIGGPWSKSLDGEHPDKDPSVLIRTAIRTCKALTGIDLSNCTQWYRFVELYYRRNESIHKGKVVPARVETVVIFLPDVWSCVPTRLEWDNLHQSYRKLLERKLNTDQETGDDTPTADEKEEEAAQDKPEPTHYSQLDLKTMNVTQLRTELKARGLNTKGLKQQLAARLTKVLKAEAEKIDKSEGVEKVKEAVETESSESTEEHKKECEEKEKKIDAKEKALLEKRYALPEHQCIIVHPSKVAKSGKFDCAVMSLSLLLDYRPEDTKEHSFEVSLFAEVYNEMLMRDFGFNIFRALHDLPDKSKEKDEKKRKEEEKKTDSDKKKDEDKKKDDDKKRDEDKKKNDRKKHDDDVKKDDKKKEDEKEKEGDKETTAEEGKAREEEEKKDEEKRESKERKEDRKSEDHKDEKYMKHENERKRDCNKKDEKKFSDYSDDEEEDEDRDRKKDRRKKERVKMYTKDKYLLLSFVYFDQTHCGYIFDKDIEELLYTLGLHLSRAQVRKLVSKVVTRDSLHYRKLTDKPKDSDFIVIDDSERDANLHELAIGNKRLLPVFSEDLPPAKKRKIESSEETSTDRKMDLVTFRGALVDVGKLISQLERSEKARLETESRMIDLKNENTKLTEKYNKSNSTIKHLNSEVKDYKEKLRNTEDSLARVSAYSKIFQSTLHDIKDKIDPVLKNTFIKEEGKRENEKEKKHEESRTRWEKEPKKGKEEQVEASETTEAKES